MTAEEKTVVENKNEDTENPAESFVAAASRGDRESFDHLVEKHQQSVINAAFYYLGHHEDALEVAQEAFLKAMTGGATGSGWTGAGEETKPSSSGGEELDEIKKQLADLQDKLSKLK